MILFQGFMVRMAANSAYRSSPAPNLTLFSFIALASEKINACDRFHNIRIPALSHQQWKDASE
jgi:hypothetical protein